MIQFFLLKNIIFFLNWILLLVFSEFVNNVRNNKIRLINNKRKAKTAKQTYSVLRINQGIQRFFNIIIHLRRVILNMSAKKKKKRKIDSHDCISLYLHFEFIMFACEYFLRTRDVAISLTRSPLSRFHRLNFLRKGIIVWNGALHLTQNFHLYEVSAYLNPK